MRATDSPRLALGPRLLATICLLASACGGDDVQRPGADPTGGQTTGGAVDATSADGVTTDSDSDGEAESETDDPGPDTDAPLQPLHRLNRLEYNNTVRDLLGTTLRPADAFGPDPEANGFDNMADQLQVSSSLLDAYDKAAREVVAEALDDVPVFRAEFTGDELAVEGGYAVGDLWALSGNGLSVQVNVPQYAEAEIVLEAGVSVVGGAVAPEAYLRVNGVTLPTFVVQGTAAIPVAHVQPIALAAGVHTIEVVPTNHVNMPAENVSNNVFVSALRVRSLELGPGPGRDLVYVCEPSGPADTACYAEIVANFATRAWRRPLTATEETNLVDFWSELQVAGESAEDALRLVMRAAMLSPKFTYRSRTIDDSDGGGWLDDYVLASRLSYFLWSSMPDDRLFDMASEGRLATDEGLSEAVVFMLADSRAEAMLDGFAEQWLSTRHLAAYTPSSEAYPAFDEGVRAAMTAESKLFFGDFLDSGSPVASIVSPDFAYRNDRLAAHYGLPSVGSAEVVRVPAGEGERRGLLSLGAWLTSTSHAEHSSPIRRGRWVTERLLCTPIPPPPPGLEFEPPDLGNAESVREALEEHRTEPSCAVCHALLDVVGIGFEEYDGVAQFVDDPDVDNLGELPGGQTFEGASELAEIYANSEAFVGCLTQTLFTYGAGRPPDDYDDPDLDAIAVRATEDEFNLVQLIDAIVHTPGFRSPAPLEESP